MLTTRTERTETYNGECQLRLPNRILRLNCVMRVYQDFVADVPTLKHADGGLDGHPAGDALRTMMARQPLEIELGDGRKGNIHLTDVQGSFVVTGPLA